MQPEDADRFSAMYRANERSVLAYFLRRTDAASARDGAAETFLVAWRRRDEVPEDDATLRWLYGVARKVLANQLRSRRRQLALRHRLSHVGRSDTPSPETVVVRRADDAATLEAVARLRPEDQEVLRLVVWEELPPRDIAVLFNTSAHAISQRLYRITKQLGRDLQRPVPHRAAPAVSQPRDASQPQEGGDRP